MSTDFEASPLLICGHPKSGTSLLVSLLDSHPELLVFPEETKYFRQIHGRPALRSAEALLAKTRVSRLVSDRATALEQGRDFSQIDASRFEESLREVFSALDPEPREAEVLPALMRALALALATDREGGPAYRHWVEKTPLHELHLNEGSALWPELRAVYVVRDPRDIYASFRKKRVARSKPLSALRFASRMQASWDAWEAFSAAAPARSHLIRFDELVAEPQRVMRGLSDWLGIEFGESMLQPSLAGLPWGGNSMFGDEHRGVSKAPVGRFKAALRPHEVRALEIRLRELMAHFGWQPVSTATPSRWADVWALLRAAFPQNSA